MGIVFAGIAPHPPLLVPQVGGGQIKKVEKTVQALKDLSRRVVDSGAESLIIITPHGPVMYDAVAVTDGDSIVGDFSQFGAGEVRQKLEIDGKLSVYLLEEANNAGVPVKFVPASNNYSPRQGTGLDHGAAVPLYYLEEQGFRAGGLHITYGLLSFSQLYKFGQVMRRAVERRGSKAAIIASGDLSHCLNPGAPAGYNPRGEEFDQKLIDLIAGYRVEDIMQMDPKLIEEAGECGLRSFIITFGALEGSHVTPEILSYEGPFGVGYLVAAFNIYSHAHTHPHPGENLEEIIPRLARDSIENYLDKGTIHSPPEHLPSELTAEKGGTFVTLKKRGELRGCIGTVEPVHSNLAEEIIKNAFSAAFRDPRFSPLQPEELSEIDISVDVLSNMELVEETSELDPRKYGILVRSDGQSGLLLPDLEGVNSVEEQLNIALQKAGISSNQPYQIYRFTVTRYAEKRSGGGE